MGRKPNPIIQQFFERGPKLDDASNRYQHSCRKCGEKFEKGRQETLIAHVTRKCQVITREERERFLMEISFTTLATPKKLTGSSEATTPQPGLSGLDALAEVSRQHGHIDYSTQQAMITDEFLNTDHDGNPIDHENPGHTTVSLLHGYSTAVSAAPMTSVASLQMAEAALNALDPRLTELEDRRGSRENTHTGDPLVAYSHGQPPAVENHRSRHSLGSYSHDELAIVEELRNHAPSSDPRQVEPAIDDATRSQYPLLDCVENQPSSFGAIEERRSSSEVLQIHQLTAPRGPLEGFGDGLHAWDAYNSTSPTVQPKKVRGAFGPDRRSAVKEVRKKGACLRCRMLKKSCDSGDPCKECAKLDNARLWKGECLRTRLAKILELFSCGLFMVVAHHEVEAAKHHGPFEAMPGRLEATYFLESGVLITFPYARTCSIDKEHSIVLINMDDYSVSDKLTLGGKLSNYMSRILLLSHQEEGSSGVFKTSKFMKETISVAMSMNQRYLIAQVLELWICTQLITVEPSELHAFINPSLPPTAATADISEGGERTPVVTDIIFLQLRRAAEKCAEILFKTVMIELEKSLIQRKQADKFETLIGSIILLRCVEQTCHMYKGFDVLFERQQHAGNDEINGLVTINPNRAPSWPLEKPPRYFWQQGERFSDLLCSMLKLRRVPPDIEVREGVLRATVDESQNIRQWFDNIQISVITLAEARARPFDAADESGWEFRWIGKLFERLNVNLSSGAGHVLHQ